MRGGGGGAVFLVMQVLEISAGGRWFPLVNASKNYFVARVLCRFLAFSDMAPRVTCNL